MEAIRERYGSEGPDYLEVGDGAPLGFVPLQARAGGDPLLSRTLIGVRACPSSELRALHDGVLNQPDHWRRAELGRWQLGQADRLLWPGGDVLGLYRRYYAGLALPPDLQVGMPPPPPLTSSSPRAARGGPLRILFLGELRRSRGPLDLLEACLSLSRDDWELTLIGADTQTATMGQSVREALEAMADGDPRVRVDAVLANAELAPALAAADILALPSRVDAWSEEGVVAMRAGLPLLATPVGGLVELVGDGLTGWLAADIGPRALARALERLLGDRGEVERVREGGAIVAGAERLADPEPIIAAYAALAAAASALPAPPPVPATGPLVSGVVPFHGASEFVSEAVESLLAQTHRQLEVLIVNDGSFAAADAVLDELARDPRVTVVTQSNAGEAAARNLGATLARGEYVVMLDADNVVEPRFVERALAAFTARPDLAYVSCWLRMIDREGAEMPAEHGYAPLGNGVVEDDSENWDGDTLALLPRRLFTELGFQYGPGGSMHSDWELYRWLRREGQLGTIIPERLARYRVLSTSLLRAHGEGLREWGWGESRDRNRARRTRWIASPPS